MSCSLSHEAPPELLNSTACKCPKGCINSCGCRKKGIKCSPISCNCRCASCTNVPEDIKNRPNLNDDVIISEDEDDEELFDEDSETILNKNNFCISPHQGVGFFCS
ncbi:hypothetical protein AVEN_262008-1 [Araneus ventricosus]|uniref:Tesmin/TSO1-like CXC domain-containing protein n=1 Tax=Araneus ventricosus TaxID=182803 RepID=A0A4Y2QSU7_ARAVE|nr:hypothetical protein AVEN_262008-1 [Araneus ventricosus]